MSFVRGPLLALALLVPGIALAQSVNPGPGPVPPDAPFAATGSSTGRTRADRAADVINALDQGLVCDGSTDNATVFARIKTKTDAATGQTVYFPPQSLPCMTSTPLSASSFTTYFAFPNSVVIKATAGNVAAPVLFNVNTLTDIKVTGLTFDGNLSAITNTNNVVQTFKSKRVDFDNVTVQNTMGIGAIFSANTSNSGFRNSRIVNFGNLYLTTNLHTDQRQGVAFCCGTNTTTTAAQGAPGTVLAVVSTTGMAIGDLISGPKTTGIQPGSKVVSLTSTSITLSMPTFSATPSGATITDSTSDKNYVINNVFETGGLDAISAANQTDFIAQGNRCISVGGPALLATGLNGGGASALWGGACVYAISVAGLNVTGNTIDNSGGNGIDIYLSSQAAIVGNTVRRSGASGISFAAGSNTTISSNTITDSDQELVTATAGSRSGIFLTGGVAGDPPLTEVLVSANTATDDQPTKTQQFGFQIQTGTTGTTGLYVDQTNQFDGNLGGAFGEVATAYSPQKVSATVTSITQTGTTPNFGVLLNLTGTGALGLGAHDGTIAGGPTLGTNALDLQTTRATNTQGATGANSCVLGGQNNSAVVGWGCTIGGQWNLSDGVDSYASGGFSQTRFRSYGWWFGGNQNAANGDSQIGMTVWPLTTATVTPTRMLAAGGGAAGAANCLALPKTNFPANQESIYGMSIRVVATDLTSPGNFMHYYEPQGTLYRSTTVATTTYLASGSAVTKTVGTIGAIAVSADTTNACLNITWTAPDTHTWHVVARIDDVEAF